MEFFRNPEIKRSLWIHLFCTAGSVVAGLLIDGRTACLTGGLGILFTLLHLISTWIRYRRIASLSIQLDHLLHGEKHISLKKYEEGELAILENELEKMIARFREQSDLLENERNVMADSMADISHQLRTPLTSIRLLHSFLEKESLPSMKRREYVQECEKLTDRIDWLIEAMLKLARMDAKAVNFKKQQVRLVDVVKKAYESLAIPMDLKEQEIEVVADGAEYFEGDFGWTVEAVLNVMKNCTEHMEKGILSVHCRQTAVFAELVIEDNGCGIREEDLPHLFERFYRGRQIGKFSDKQSIGIGLALSRMIILSQNGTIKAENRVEGGARFLIRFYRGII